MVEPRRFRVKATLQLPAPSHADAVVLFAATWAVQGVPRGAAATPLQVEP
jgi:hypothetical protein